MLDYLPADRTAEQRRENIRAIIATRWPTRDLAGLACDVATHVITGGNDRDAYNDAVRFYEKVRQEDEQFGTNELRELAAEALARTGWYPALINQRKS